MVRCPTLSLLFLIATSAVAWAEPPADTAVADCIARTTQGSGDGRACIGVYADACLERGEDPSVSGEAACSYRETEVWEAELNAAYRRLMERLPRKAAASLRDSERSWIETRKLTCGFYSVFYDGGSMARPMSAACHNRHTAERVLFLQAFGAEPGSAPE